MEHFKKRLIHQHQKPPSNKLSPMPIEEDGDDDASSSSSTSSGSNGGQTENKKDGNVQSKVARQRSSCRSKFRHDSLKLFKLGSSIPTSLCKSKEPYNVSAEKNLQLCSESKTNHRNKNLEKPSKTKTITEQIISTIEGNSKKENNQKSRSLSLDFSPAYLGKHNLPPIIPELPTKRRKNSVSKSSEDEQSIGRILISNDTEQIKPDDFKSNLGNYKRKYVFEPQNENQADQQDLLKSSSYQENITPLPLKNQMDHNPLDKIERKSPDSTSTEKETSMTVSNNTTSNIFTNTNAEALQDKSPFLGVNFTLPQNTSITPIVSSKEKLSKFNTAKNFSNTEPQLQQIQMQFPKNITNNYQIFNNSLTKHPIIADPQLQNQTLVTQSQQKNNIEHPINLSVKNVLEMPHNNSFLPTSYPTSFVPQTNLTDTDKDIYQNSFPQIQQQMSRLQNFPPVVNDIEQQLGFQKPFEESIARSVIEMAYSVMYAPFSVDNLIVLNYSYKKLVSLTLSKFLTQEVRRNIQNNINEIVVYVTLKLFDKVSIFLKNYTQRILELELEAKKDLLQDVIYLINKKCYDREWMENFMNLLSRNDRKKSVISENFDNASPTFIPTTGSNIIPGIHVPYNQPYPTNWPIPNLYPPIVPPNFLQGGKAMQSNYRKTNKSKSGHSKKQGQHNKKQQLMSAPQDPFKIDSYPTDNRYIPPKISTTVVPEIVPPKMPSGELRTQQIAKEEVPTLTTQSNDTISNKIENNNQPDADKSITFETGNTNLDKNINFETDAVIVKDKSMEVTKGDKEVAVKQSNENDIEKIDVVVEKIPNSELIIKTEYIENQPAKKRSLDDLHLFKELLMQEDKKIYNKILKKICNVKESAKEVITIDDEEDPFPTGKRSRYSSSKTRKISSISNEVVVIDDDKDYKEEETSDFNQNYIPEKIQNPNNIKVPHNTQSQEPSMNIKDSINIVQHNNILDSENLSPKTLQRRNEYKSSLPLDVTLKADQNQQKLSTFQSNTPNQVLTLQKQNTDKFSPTLNIPSQAEEKLSTFQSNTLNPQINFEVLTLKKKNKDKLSQTLNIPLEAEQNMQNLSTFQSITPNSDINFEVLNMQKRNKEKLSPTLNVTSQAEKNMLNLSTVQSNTPNSQLNFEVLTLQKKNKDKLPPRLHIPLEAEQNLPQPRTFHSNSPKSQINYEVLNLSNPSSIENKESNFALENKPPILYEIGIEAPPEYKNQSANYQILLTPEISPKIFSPPSSAGTTFYANNMASQSSSGTPDSVSSIVRHSPSGLMSPSTPKAGLSIMSSKQEPNGNWKSWISEERKKGLLDAGPPATRRQSVETISSVGSDYSPVLDPDDDYVKIRIEKKCYRVKKSIIDSIPIGKLCYIREKNYLVRYFDDNQLSQFIQNMNINLVSPAASNFLKQIRDRVDVYLSDDIFLTPYEVPTKNEVIELGNDISFTREDYIAVPELYVEEVEKVERFVPKDFHGFYKYVTGYQIVNNHHPISFQTFLAMHNTNGIKVFYKKYLLSILENKYL